MKLSIAAKKKREAYIFILPGFIYLLIVCGYPLIYNIVLSFRNVNVRNIASGDSVFVGFENYIELFRDPTFLMVFRNTILVCYVFFKEVYSGRACPRLNTGRIYDAHVCYSIAGKKYVSAGRRCYQ